MFHSNKSIIKTVITIGLATILFVVQPDFCVKAETITGGNPVAGISNALSEFYSDSSKNANEKAAILTADYKIPENVAIANVNNQLNIRKGPSTDKERVGLLDNGSACIISEIEGEWAKITSGTIEGYAFLEYLITGDDAIEYVKEHFDACVTVEKSVTNLNIRSEASTTSDILGKAKGGTSLKIINDCVINKDDDNKVWVEVEYEKDKHGFVSAEFVEFTYDIPWAAKYTPYGAGVSDLRCNICDYAKQFIGTKYVWGGNDLKKGVDCSGYVKKIFAKFGYTTPRVSRDQAAKYKKITKSELKPGDLVFYGNTKTGYINHVAIYIGNDKIIHASSNNTKYYKCGDVEITSLYFYSSGNNYGIVKYATILGIDK